MPKNKTLKTTLLGRCNKQITGGGLWTMKKRNYSKGNGGYLRRKEHPNKIRNGKIRRDFKRLLEIIADGREPHFPEVEEIAGRHAMDFNDYGKVVEIQPNERKKERE